MRKISRGGRKATRRKVEQILGKKLCWCNQVHHINGDQTDKSNSNLVVCENALYHALIHTRAEAYAVTGNPNFRKCIYCLKFSDPITMLKISGTQQTKRYAHHICNRIVHNIAHITKRDNIFKP
jgi:hypothetical protein